MRLTRAWLGVEHSGMARRPLGFGFLPLLALLTGHALGCHGEASQETEEAPAAEGESVPTDDTPSVARSTAREEPMRLPFDDFRPSADADPYSYQRTLSAGCTLSYQRWWGIPPDPGAPVSHVAVRSARLAGVAAYALVYDVGGAEERVWRRGEGYQVALTFEGCTPAAVDAVLAGSEALTSPLLGTDMPGAETVCMGPRAALVVHMATPSRAGSYAPDMRIQGEHLNWTVPGVGCVTYPALSTDVPCGGGSHPWVATTLCQQ